MNIRIKDICCFGKKSDIKAGEGNTKGKYMFFTSSIDKDKRIDKFDYDEEGIIMGTGGNATLHYCSGKFAVSTDCLVLLPNSSYKCKYLYYFFLHNMRVLEGGFRGAGLKHTSKSYIENIELTKKHSLLEQDKIISLLSNIDNTIVLQNKRLKLLNELTRSLFIEMFGDPIYNSKNWQVVQIGDIAKDVRYGTSNPAVEGGKYPYLRMNNITVDGKLDLGDLKYIDISDYELEKYVVRKGDLLFNRTNSIELVGKTTTFNLNEDMIIAGYIIRVRLNNQMLPEVLSQYMNLEVIKSKLRDMAKGAVNQANINAQELQSIRVYLPDIDIQKKFVKIKCKLDKSKLAVKKSLEELEILKKSLMQKYFA